MSSNILNIKGIEVKFPFEPYELQKDYMTQVITALEQKKHAVLESPTGTGKTLCLLTSTLGWLKHKRASKKYQIAFEKEHQESIDFLNQLNNIDKNWNENDHRIVYTSRTHSQLAQAMKEMKVTSYNDLNGVALGSRDQLCINDDVMKAATSSEKINLCRAKVKAKQCSYHSHVDRCVDRPREQTILDIEDLIKVGKSCGACPYFLAKKLSEKADIVFLPYNYILDSRLLKSFNFQLRNSVVIFDEAHNVEKVCQDAASIQLTSSDIAMSIDDITHIMKSLEDNQENVSLVGGDENEVDISTEDCAKMKEILLDFEKQIDGISQVTAAGRTFHGAKIFDFLEAANITAESSPIIIKLMSTLYEYLSQVSAGKAFGRKGYGISKLMEFLDVVYGLKIGGKENWRDTVDNSYRLHVENEEKKSSTTKRGTAGGDGWINMSASNSTISANAKILNYWCFNPGLGMKGLMNRDIHSIILTSGTLSPIKPLVGELALDAECQLENPHIVKSSQVYAKIISQGPDGTILNASYQNRDNPKYIQSLAFTIKTVATQTPNGLLVFFPSYTLMNKTQETWRNNGMWDAIHEVKPIFTEPKHKTDFEECMSEYYAAVKTSRGAIFMAVLRGKVSEGLDFKDENGRAVIIIGLPFAPYQDPRVILKKEYLEKNRTSKNLLVTGQEWYNMDATRAVNQAIGRVIRHKDDYGAILLCDQRFSYYKSGLSRWVRSHLQNTNNEKFMFGPIIRDLGKFFKVASSADLKRVEMNPKVEKEFHHQITEQKVNTMMIKQQIKYENSNQLYSSCSSSGIANRSSLKAEDLKSIEEFVKNEEKKPSSIFLENVNSSGASSIDFNALASSQTQTQAQASRAMQQQPAPQFASTAAMSSKKRKFKVTTNSQEPKFVFCQEPVKIKREIYQRQVPDDRKTFLDEIKVTFDSQTYKFLLSIISTYHHEKDFSKFWNKIMPMFKFHIDKIFILIGLKRFLVPDHKFMFDAEMKKHFIVE